MNEKLMYMLLSIVKKDGDVRQLLKEDIDYKEIGDLINKALELKFLAFQDEKIILTSTGNKKLAKDWINFKSTNKKDWILPDTKNKISKIGKYDIYLPDESELAF